MTDITRSKMGVDQERLRRRAPLVVAAVLAIVFSGFAYLIATVRW